MTLGGTLGSEVGTSRGSTNVFSRGTGGGELEDSLMGDTMVSGPSHVFLGGSGEVYPLGESLGSESGSEGGSSSEIWGSFGSVD